MDAIAAISQILTQRRTFDANSMGFASKSVQGLASGRFGV
jgi:hypothetical protein